MLGKCCNEFVQAVYSEANEISNKENKTTITPDHIIQAMQELGFDAFVDDVKAAHEQWKAEQQRTWVVLAVAFSTWRTLCGELSSDESNFPNQYPTEHAQKYNRKTGAEVAGMSEEEQIALQQQMFAAAAAQAGMDTS